MKNLYKAQRLELQLANGLDSILESKDRQRQAKQTRESKKSQQNKRHNTDITSSHTESKQKDSTHSTSKTTDVKNTQSHTLDSKNNTKESKKQNNTEQQNLDSLLTLTLINGGYKEKYWGFGEENTQANLLHTNTESKDSKAAQENRDKQILEIYFSYGEDTTRLQGDSRHTQDVNLHIKTQGYNNGEEIHITLEIQGEKLSVSGIIQDNQAIIMNVLSSKGK